MSCCQHSSGSIRVGVLLNPSTVGQFRQVDRLVLAAPRVLQPGHASQFISKILLDDGLVEAINNGKKDLSDISVPVSIFSFFLIMLHK
jgi:hypothetical protein